MATTTMRSFPILPIIITILAFADGLVHFTLDLALFRGRFFGSAFGSGRPPGPLPGGGAAPGGATPPPGPRLNQILPLNELFLLNLVGYLVLILLFWLGPRWFGTRRWLLDVALLIYVAVVFLAWLSFGRPNPMGLGYVSKSIEILLIIALVVHTRILLGRRRVVP